MIEERLGQERRLYAEVYRHGVLFTLRERHSIRHDSGPIVETTIEASLEDARSFAEDILGRIAEKEHTHATENAR